MRFDILTIFPDIFTSFKNEALIARSQKKKIISINTHNLRDWTTDAHQSVDDRPYGGGAGMVMLVEPIQKAVQDLKKTKQTHVIAFSAKGKTFNQGTARRLAKYPQIVMICGRYEGIDERVIQYVADEEISIGDYVLFGGEVPAMVLMEAITRLLPGAIGKQSSLTDESFNKTKGIVAKQRMSFLEYSHYTRPESIKIKGKLRNVPAVLLSGNHQKIEAWRQAESLKSTKKKRPDLL
jgi:tRNA (guanine37-N1)-methyltransferase